MAGRGLFKRLIEPEEAVRLIAESLGWRLAERLLGEAAASAVHEGLGRLVAEDVIAPRSLPWYPRSLVDGCAVRSVDVAGAFEDRPVRLRVLGRVKIGVRPGLRVGAGECAEVDTGAWVPLGADAVVPIEYVERRDGFALVYRGAVPGQSVAAPASDVARGDIIVRRGTPWTPRVAAALAALGLAEARLSRRPRAAVFSTGDELVEPGRDAGDAGVYDSNRPLIKSILYSMGWKVADYGIIGDSVDDVEDAMLRAANDGADVIIASGGTSAGVDDVVYKAAGRVGRVLFHGLRLKPGKPTLAATLGDRLFLGLPGNPRSSANVMERLALPAFEALGLPTWPRARSRTVSAATIAPLAPEKGRDTIVPVALVYPGPVAVPVAKDSYMIASYAMADGETIVPASLHEPIKPGSVIRVEADEARLAAARRGGILVTADWVDPAKLRELAGNNERIVYYPARLSHSILELLPSGLTVVASSLDGITPTLGAQVLERRRVLLAVHSYSSCKGGRAAVPRVYAGLAGRLGPDVVALGVPRVESARIMLKQGYVDCALLPDNAVDATLQGAEVVAEEDIIVFRVRRPGTPHGGREESAGSTP